jgi:hypothetical protein
VIEVVLDVGRRFDEGDPNTAAYVEDFGSAVRELRTGRSQIGHTERHVRECSLLARTFRVEQGQFASTRVASQQREIVLTRDHVHPEVPLEELGDRIAVRDPECDMIESLRLHGARII